MSSKPNNSDAKILKFPSARSEELRKPNHDVINRRRVLTALAGVVAVAAFVSVSKLSMDSSQNDGKSVSQFYDDVNKHPDKYEEVLPLDQQGENKLAESLAPGADSHTNHLEEVLKLQRTGGVFTNDWKIVPRGDVEAQPAQVQPVETPVGPR